LLLFYKLILLFDWKGNFHRKLLLLNVESLWWKFVSFFVKKNSFFAFSLFSLFQNFSYDIIFLYISSCFIIRRFLLISLIGFFNMLYFLTKKRIIRVEIWIWIGVIWTRYRATNKSFSSSFNDFLSNFSDIFILVRWTWEEMPIKKKKSWV